MCREQRSYLIWAALDAGGGAPAPFGRLGLSTILVSARRQHILSLGRTDIVVDFEKLGGQESHRNRSKGGGGGDCDVLSTKWLADHPFYTTSRISTRALKHIELTYTSLPFCR